MATTFNTILNRDIEDRGIFIHTSYTKKFVEDYYEWTFDNMRIADNKVIYFDNFSVEGACYEDNYYLDKMVKNIKNFYPDVEALGIGSMYWGVSPNTTYILIANSDNIVFLDDYSDDYPEGVSALYYFIDFGSVEAVMKEVPYEEGEFSIEKIKNNMERLFSKYAPGLTVYDFLTRLGVEDKVRELFC